MKKFNWQLKLGIALIILALLLFSFLFVIHLFKIDNTTKVKLYTITLISQKITLWLGIFLIGERLFVKYKSYLNPKKWFKKRVG
ncbi:transporter suffix domain-containing protein [Bacteroidota bacterium]